MGHNMKIRGNAQYRILQGIHLEEDVAHRTIMIIKQFKKTAHL